VSTQYAPRYYDESKVRQPSWRFDDAYAYGMPSPRYNTNQMRPRARTIEYSLTRRPVANSRSQMYLIREHRRQTVSETFYHNLIKEEIAFSMNKLSLTALLGGLMFLGALFFVSGFLVAVNVYTAKSLPNIIPSEVQAHNPLAKPSHAPSANPGASISRASQQPQYMVPPQFATVDGVSMVQQPRLPSTQQAGMIAPNPNAQYVQRAPSHAPSQGALPQAAQPYYPPQALPVNKQQYPYAQHVPKAAPAPNGTPQAYVIPQYATQPISTKGY